MGAICASTVSSRVLTSILVAVAGVGIALVALSLGVDGDSLRGGVLTSVALFAALVILKRDNLLYLLRTAILGAVGFLPIVVKAMYGSGTYFSSYEFRSQSIDIALIMYLGTAMALLGNEIGLAMGDPKYRLATSYRSGGQSDFHSSDRTRSIDSVSAEAHTSPHVAGSRNDSQWRAAFYVSVPIVIAASILVARSNGPLIFFSGYSGAVQPLAAGSIPAIGVFGLLVAFVASHKVTIKHSRAILVLLGVLLIVWAMLLRGDRNDAISALIGLIILSSALRYRSTSVRLRTAVALGILAIALFLFGTVRSLDYSSVSAQDLRSAVTSRGLSGNTVNLGAVSAIASTFANTVWLVDRGAIEIIPGGSYAEYVLRTPPAFLSPGRPDAYALQARELGVRTGGGFFELGEAYMNFGMFGFLFVPLAVSYLLAWIYSQTLRTQRFGYYLALIGLLAVFTRGTWYQTFSFYRGLTIALALWAVFRVAYGFMQTRTSNQTRTRLEPVSDACTHRLNDSVLSRERVASRIERNK